MQDIRVPATTIEREVARIALLTACRHLREGRTVDEALDAACVGTFADWRAYARSFLDGDDLGNAADMNAAEAVEILRATHGLRARAEAIRRADTAGAHPVWREAAGRMVWWRVLIGRYPRRR
jgi:hypothetical protein